MIKCGELEGEEQCILYSKDGSKVLGRFPYSKHGGQKGAKAAAHKREGQIQFFKKKHQGLLEAIEAFGAPVVLKYLLDAGCPDCEKVVKAHVAEWLEKARGEGQGVGGPRQGDGGADQCVCPECGATAAHEKGTPCNEQKCPKCGVAMAGQAAEKSEIEKAGGFPSGGPGKPPPGYNVPKNWTPESAKKYWDSIGGSVTACMKKLGGKKAARFCASLKDYVTGTTKWRKGRGKAKKSLSETIEDALTLLEKHDEDEEMELDDIDLSELEAWLSGEEAAEVEPESTEEPEPEGDVEPEPEPITEPEPEPVEEQPLDFRTFLLREHAQRRADILAMLGEEVIEDG